MLPNSARCLGDGWDGGGASAASGWAWSRDRRTINLSAYIYLCRRWHK
jgi:hypothetical protein